MNEKQAEMINSQEEIDEQGLQQSNFQISVILPVELLSRMAIFCHFNRFMLPS